MSDATFSRRWLLLSLIGMFTSFLLTIGIAAFGMRGTAQADQRPSNQQSSPANRVPGGTFFIKEIGGLSRTPTPAAGTAPTLHLTEEPFRPLLRTAPAGAPAMQPTEPPPAPEPEPSDVRPAAPVPPARSASTARAPVTTDTEASAWTPTTNPTAPPTSATTATPVPAVLVAGPTATVIPTSIPTPTTAATATATATKTPVRSNDPPRAAIHLSESKVEAGDAVTITVSGQDERGLDWIVWESDSGDKALEDEHRHDCDGKTTCIQSWTVRVTRLGTHTIEARARGESGLRSETEEAYLRVRERAAPTAVPTSTSTPSSASATSKR